jgi:RHS repeat-associated protein
MAPPATAAFNPPKSTKPSRPLQPTHSSGASTTDQAGNIVVRGADAFGRLRWVKENAALPGAGAVYYSTLYTYDPLDNLTSVNQSGQSRTFSYDSLKRLTSANNPESGGAIYTYDNNGNLQTKTDARGNVTTYSIDPLNRVYSKTYTLANGTQPTNPVNYVYDINATGAAIGHLTSVSNETGSSPNFTSSKTTYDSFDALGHPGSTTQTTLGTAYTFYYTYNLAGSITAETLPSNRVLTTTFDNLNRPLSVSAGSKAYASNVAYWPHGGVYSYSRNNGLNYGATYNSRLQLTETDEAVPASPTNTFLWVDCPNWGLGGASGPYGACPPLSTLATNNGNLLSTTAHAPADGATAAAFGSLTGIQQSFAYDGLNRITSIQDNGSGAQLARTFGYDAYGNMWIPSNAAGLPSSANPAPPTAQSAFNASNNQLVNGNYDLSGNQQTVGTFTLAYDAENRQVSETTTGGTSPATYLYDGDGRRVEKLVGTIQTFYIYDASGNLSAEYTNGPTLSGCQTCYLSYDHLGSTRMVTDENHQVVERHDYMPFGDEILSGNAGRGSLWGLTTGVVDQKFTGKERDGESQLDYFGARYYGSALGRFTSPDWNEKPQPVPYADLSNPQTLNLYAYLLNNPLGHADIDGHEDLLEMAKRYLTAMFQPVSGVEAVTNPGVSSSPSSFGMSDNEMASRFTQQAGKTMGTLSNLLNMADPTGIGSVVNSAMLEKSVGGTLLAMGMALLPGGEAERAASNFGFKSFESMGSVVGGELAGGGTALVGFAKSGSDFGVNISMVAGPAGTLDRVLGGAIAAAKGEGASSLTITASMVKDSMGRLLRKNGFSQEIKNGEKTGRWIKKVDLQ